MSEEEERVRRVLRAYAELTPLPPDRDALVAAPPADFAWLGTAGSLFVAEGSPAVRSIQFPPSPSADRLARLGALHREESLLREGWVLLAGTVEIDGRTHRILQPVLSRPVQLKRRSLVGRVARTFLEAQVDPDGYVLSAVGEAELTPLVEQPGTRAQLERSAQFGGGALILDPLTPQLLRRLTKLRSWIEDVVAAAGLELEDIAPTAGRDPYEFVDRPGLRAVVGSALYLSRTTSQVSLRSTLLNWASREDLGATALGRLLATDASPPRPPDDQDVESPVRLSPSQRSVVIRSREAPLTVVSGAPGTGKTHTVCAVALDAVARGRSVLIATRSGQAASVVAELLDRTPGPDPVRFGDAVGMTALIDELNDRLGEPVEDEKVHELELARARARAAVDGLRRTITLRLELEARASEAAEWTDALPSLMATAPGLFEPDADLDRAAAALAAAGGADGGWWAGRRRRRARRELDELARSNGGASTADLELALDAARSRRALAALGADDLDVDAAWDRLVAAEDRLRHAVGEHLAVLPVSASALGADTRRAVGRLVAALRSGRARRRELLAELDADDLTRAAPLWIGTLAEIDDVLPATPRLFDLVILDEASQIEQPRAATALLRGRRAVVVGDPHQLRHVSFLSDRVVDDVLAAHGLAGEGALLDVRRTSAFDLAAAATPVTVLREHYRSVPHLVEFPIRHFYRDEVAVMTRRPSNETLDAIDVLAVPAGRSSEIGATCRLLTELLASGATDVGVITPYRDHAEALEDAIVARFTDHEIDRLGLRVGTVHGFQGGERDVMIAALGVDADEGGRRRFMEEPNLFNVMVTRARERLVLVTSLDPSVGGLVGDFIRYADHGLAPVGSSETRSPWVADVAVELERNGIPVRVGYPVGRWRLDLVAGPAEDATCIDCAVGPDGAAAHLERGLELRALGWRTVTAFPGRWDRSAARAALDLAPQVGPAKDPSTDGSHSDRMSP